MIKTYTILLFLFFSNSLLSQSLTWQRLYSGPPPFILDHGRGMCEATNGNFYVAGYNESFGAKAQVLKLKPNGDTIWTRFISSNAPPGLIVYAVAPSGDGGCVITGIADSAYLLKLDSNGNTAWFKKYERGSIQTFDIKKTSDGGYIVCGFTPGLPSHGYILKTDPYGNMQWEKKFLSIYSKRFLSIIEAPDSGYLLTGSQYDCDVCVSYSFVLRINNNGDSLWQSAQIERAQYKKIEKIKDGYLIGGIKVDTTVNTVKIFLIKVTLKGNIYFQKIISSYDRQALKDIKVINENRYVIAAETDTVINDTLMRVGGTYITDSLGNVLHRNIFRLTDYTRLFSILPFSNGDIGFAGTVYYMFGTNVRDIYVIRADSTLFAKPLSIRNINSFVFQDYKLYQNYPNPFNPSTKIRIEIPANASNSEKVIKIFDVLGREIKIFDLSKNTGGTYEIEFNGENLSSGIYFYSLIIDDQILHTRKMILLR